MSRYLILPRLEVIRANALAAGGVITLAPVMAATLMGTAFEVKTKIKITGVMLIHHDARFHGERDLGKYSGDPDYYLHMLKGASLFDSDDMAGSPKSGSLGANASQPSAFMSGCWSIVFRLPDESRIPASRVKQQAAVFLRNGARLAGGQIVNYESPVVTSDLPGVGFEAASEATSPITEFDKAVHSGFVFVDQTHLLASGDPGQNRVERLMELAVGGRGDGGKRQWRSPAVLGYALTSPLAPNQASRENLLHAFSEPLIGLVGLCSLRQMKERKVIFDELFWSPCWPDTDVFLISQSNTIHEV